MKNKRRITTLCLLLLILLSAAMAISMVGCAKEEPEVSAQAKTFTVEIWSASGAVQRLEMTSDQQTVGAALLAEGLIKGEDGPYGLMIQEVNGERHVFEEDGKYWAFYIDGEYAMTGVDSTDLLGDVVYAFKVE